MSERRGSLRKSLRTIATVHVAGQTVRVRTMDISVGGMAIVAAVNPPPGMTFELEFDLLIGSRVVTIRAKAQVMHSVLSSAESGFRIGLSFLSIDPASVSAIEQYLR